MTPTIRMAFSPAVALLISWQTEERTDGFRCGDVFHRLLDGTRRAWPGPGGARLRVRLGAGTFACPAVAQDAVPRRRRYAETVLRHDGPVRHADRGSDGDDHVEGGDRRVSG